MLDRIAMDASTVAGDTARRPFLAVDSLVPLEVAQAAASKGASGAAVWLLARMGTQVARQVDQLG